jgi:hypothetical protein
MDLGLDYQRAKKLASKLRLHSVNFPVLLSGGSVRSTCNPPDPHYFFLFFGRGVTVPGTNVAPTP